MQRREFLSIAAAAGMAGCAVPGQDAASPDTDGALSRIAFGSCADQTQAQPIWDTILATRPEFFIFGGDNVYASGSAFSLARLTEAYETQDQIAGFARLKGSVPHMAIWDDNDYGANDGGADFGHKFGSKAAFMQFWRVAADDARRRREGLYDAQVIGPAGKRVQVIVLDTRWFRSPWKVTDQRDAPGKERYVPDADPGKTMLGDAQWRWLEEQLRQPAEVRLLFSSIQTVVEGHGWERWGNFPAERQWLYRLIADTRAHGVVFMSGDRHIGALYRETAGTPYPFYEITASGFTHTWRGASEAGPNRLGEPFKDLHFGTIDIDWKARALQLALRDTAGAVQRSQLIRLNELKAA
jgi:alkaline phosphatase D